MSKLNWNKLKRRDRETVLRREAWDAEKKPKKPLHVMSETLKELFDAAEKKSIGTEHYRAVWSIRRWFLLKGSLTAKQGSYIRRIAKGQCTENRGSDRP